MSQILGELDSNEPNSNKLDSHKLDHHESNRHELERRLLRQLSESIKPKDKVPLLEWTEKFRRTEKGARFSFVQRPYLKQIYNDESPTMVIKKATQVGVTEYALSRALHFAIESAPVTVIYTMPTASDIRDLVAARLNPSLSKSPAIRDEVGRVDSISVKEIAGSFLYFRGCVDEETEVLTCGGWKKYDQVREGESLPTLNTSTEEIEIQKINHIHLEDFDGYLHSIKNKTFDTLTTLDHRCLYRSESQGNIRVRRAAELKRACWLPLKTQGWKGTDKEVFSDGFVKVLGWTITDGCYSPRRWKSHSKGIRDVPFSGKGARVTIVQKSRQSKLEEALDESGFTYWVSKKGNCNAYTLDADSSREVQSIIPDKKLRPELLFQLTRKQLDLLYEAMMDGDGSWRHGHFYQKDEETSDAFQMLVTLIGYGSRKSLKKCEGTFGPSDAYCIKKYKAKNIGLHNCKQELVRYKGKVWCPQTDNGTVFTRRNGRVCPTGQSFTEREAMSVPSDLNLHDEVDYSNQNILSQYMERLTASKYKQKVSFSKPSVPHFGIDKLFEESDQHEFFIDCQKCGWSGLPTMENIDPTIPALICPKCGKRLDRRKGHWEAAYPQRDIRGYHVDQLTSAFVTIESILGKWKGPEAYTKADFENQVRGKASSTGIGLVNRGVVLRQCFNDPVEKSSAGNGRYMGIDQNGRMSVVVSEIVDGKRHIVEMLEVEDDTDWTEMHKMMHLHGIRTCVIDLRPEARMAEKFAKQYPGRVYCCEFVKSLKECYFDSSEDWLIKGSRTLILDGTSSQIQKGLTQIYPMDESIETYIKHWERLTRSEKEDNMGRTIARWDSSGADHLALADCYNRLAVKITVGDMDMYSEPTSEMASTVPREGISMLREKW